MRPRLMQHLTVAAVMCVSVAAAIPESSESAGEVSIESAKREFDTLLDPSSHTSESPLRLPKISGPQMPVVDEIPGGMTPTRKTTLEEQRNKARADNWLLDAMLEQPEDDTESDSLKKEQEALRADPFKQMIAEQVRQTKKNEDEEAEIAEADRIEDQVVNPLSAFMTDWVSDRDRELLVPDAKQSTGQGWWGGLGPPSSGASLNSTTTYTEISSEVRAFDEIEHGETSNPYLNFQTPVFEEPVRRASTQIIPQLHAESTERSSLERSPAPRALAPVSPLINREDEAEKYFPQLKRF